MKLRAYFSKRRLAALTSLAAAVLAIAAAACGSGDPTAPAAASTPTMAPGSGTSTAGATPTTAASPASELGRGGTLRIAITAADVPLTDQATDQGAEGNRWAGFTLGDGLVDWELGQNDHVPGFIEGIAESWEIDPEDPTRWLFKLRSDATYHDGTPIDAESIVYNYDRLLNPDAANFNATLSAGKGPAKSTIASYGVVDESTFEIVTQAPDSFLLYQVVAIWAHSPTAMEAAGPDDYRNDPQGSGPFKFVSKQARTSLVMEPYEDYYKDKARLDRLIILPMSEATTRLAALRTNAVDWIEVPPPDAIPGLEADGFDIYMTQTAHNWPHQFNLSKAPFDNKLVRQALNYAIDRESLCRDLLNDTCEPGLSFANQATPWVGESEQVYSYDPEKAKALLAEAGVELPLTYKVLISASGSGQMLPVPMNEFVQRNLAEIGIEMEIEVIEWNTYIGFLRSDGFASGQAAEYDAVNVSWLSVDPSGFVTLHYSASTPPNGWNIPGYNNPEFDSLVDQARATSDIGLRDEMLTEANQILTEDAPWLWIAHDRNPRVLSPKVKNYVQEKHTYTSVVNVWVE